MKTKRGADIVRHILPEPTEFERELAVRQLSGEAREQNSWPTHVVDGEGHYLLLPPGSISATGGTTDLINWQTVSSTTSRSRQPNPRTP